MTQLLEKLRSYLYPLIRREAVCVARNRLSREISFKWKKLKQEYVHVCDDSHWNDSGGKKSRVDVQNSNMQKLKARG